MGVYRWEGIARNGQVRSGTKEAPNEAQVLQFLRSQQIRPKKIKPLKSGGLANFNFLGGGVGAKEIVIFTRQFATMIDAGLPLVQCLDILANQQENRIFQAALRDIKGHVEEGATFSDALRRHPRIFDDLYANLVQAGEVGGILDTILNRLAIYIEKNVKLVRQVRGAMVYPLSVLCIALGVMAVLLSFVIPAFKNMFKDFGAKDALPKLTQWVVAFSHGFVSYFPLIALVLIGTAVGFVYTYRTPAGKRTIHRIMLQLPVLGPVLRKIAVARFTRTLGTLLQSGVPILDALEIVA